MPRRILIVEDNVDFRRILTFMLSRAGYEVMEALDGLQGIARATKEAPDLIIMDLGLPEIDGLETTRRLKRNPKTAPIPVIAYTVWGEEFREKALEAGIKEYVSKIISPTLFKEMVEKFLPAAA